MCKKPKSPTQFTRDDVEILHQEPMYKGFFSITKYRFRHSLYAGGMSEPVVREVFQRGKAVLWQEKGIKLQRQKTIKLRKQEPDVITRYAE